MIARRFRSRRKTKHILSVISLVVLWQFSFPQHVVAQSAVVERITFEPLPVLSEVQSPLMYRLPENPDKPQPEARRIMQITVTAYSSTPDQTDGSPFITAAGTHVRDGIIAANFLPIGSQVRFPEYFGDKIFVVEDRMSARYWHTADIWMPTREAAIQWGVRYITVEIL